MQSVTNLRARHCVLGRSSPVLWRKPVVFREIAAAALPHRALEADKKRAGRPVQIDAASCAPVRRWLQEQNDLTLAKVAGRLPAQGGLCGSTSCVWRLLQRV